MQCFSLFKKEAHKVEIIIWDQFIILGNQDMHDDFRLLKLEIEQMASFTAQLKKLFRFNT